MSLAPIIELYMTLKRRESTLCNEFISFTRNTPAHLELHTTIFKILSMLLALLRDEENPASAQTWITHIQRRGADLAALDEVTAGITRKIHEIRFKCTYTARQQIVLKLSEPTSRVLTSSVALIARMKREIEVFLQQM